MTARRILFAFIALLFGAALPGASPALAGRACSSDGIGGTGMPSQHDAGIGGTGSPAHGDGTGGTGAIARDDGIGGTGIVGIITGFGSICVNGIEVHYDNTTPVDAGGQPAKAGALAIGQVVAVDAAGSGGDVRARRISIVMALSGPVTDIPRGRGKIAVMGQIVEVAPGTALPKVGGPGKNSLKPGDVVQVSGLRRPDGTVVATHIAADPRPPTSVTGLLMPRPGGGFAVHGLPVELPVAGAHPAGTEVRLSGNWNGRALVAREVVREPVQGMLDRAGRIEIQGYVELQEGTTARVSGRQVVIPPGAPVAGGKERRLASGDRVRISARVTADRRLVADRVTVEQQGRPHIERLERSRQQTPESGSLEALPTTVERTERHQEVERESSTERPEREERTEKVEKAEKAEKAEKPEKVEKPEKAEKPEKPEKPEKVEKPEKPEKPEKAEKPEKPEKIERRSATDNIQDKRA